MALSVTSKTIETGNDQSFCIRFKLDFFKLLQNPKRKAQTSKLVRNYKESVLWKTV